MVDAQRSSVVGARARLAPDLLFCFVFLQLLPGYGEVIPHPMDLSTMQQKLEEHEYASFQSFVADFILMCNNAITFNPRCGGLLPSGKRCDSP